MANLDAAAPLATETDRPKDDPTRWQVDDALWAELAPILQIDKPRKKPGRPRRDDRAIFDGLIWLARTGSQWSQLPRQFCPKSTVHLRFTEWIETGKLAQARARISATMFTVHSSIGNSHLSRRLSRNDSNEHVPCKPDTRKGRVRGLRRTRMVGRSRDVCRFRLLRATGVVSRPRIRVHSLDLGERLLEVGDQIADGFKTDRKSNVVLTDTGRGLLFLGKLRMCGRRRVDDERLGVADVG